MLVSKEVYEVIDLVPFACEPKKRSALLMIGDRYT